jgi:hypothetical protein
MFTIVNARTYGRIRCFIIKTQANKPEGEDIGRLPGCKGKTEKGDCPLRI